MLRLLHPHQILYFHHSHEVPSPASSECKDSQLAPSNIRQSRLLLPHNLANALHFLKLHAATHVKARSKCGVRQENVQLAGRQVPCSFETTAWMLLITEIDSLHLVTPMLSR